MRPHPQRRPLRSLDVPSSCLRTRNRWQRCILCTCIIVVAANTSISMWMFGSSANKNMSRQCRAVLVLFGLPKSFPVIWQGYKRNIINNNPHIHFDVSMHLYSDVKVLTNLKNAEHGVRMESSETLVETIGDSDDVLVQTSQAEFDAERLGWIEKKHTNGFDTCCWTTDTLRNMFRQGNSMTQSYKHALARGVDYDIFVFARPDTFLGQPIDISCDMAENELVLPSWQIWRGKEHNDRFAVCGRKAADIYVRAKSEGFYEYVKEGRDTWNSEHMLKRWLTEQRVDVKEAHSGWAPLLRIRGGNWVNVRDALTFPLSFVRFVFRDWL